MLTLCRVDPAASIRPPEASQLKEFKFFTTRTRQADGSDRVYLHMGYFTSQTEARHWTQLMRSKYPNVFATPVPAALLRHPDSGIPTLSAAGSSSPTQSEDPSLSDTEVLNILETRRVSPAQDGASEKGSAEISLLRPEDTVIRRTLKAAVVQRAPVSFAVQLASAAEPIDLSSIPSNSIFRAYTLYVAQGQYEGQTMHCVRLGFFNDAISAKQVAYFVRATFPSVAVVAVVEQERSRAEESRLDTPKPSDSFKQHLDAMLGSDGARAQNTSAGAATAPPQAAQPQPQSAQPSAAPGPRPQLKPTSGLTARTKNGETLEQTLELLSSSELWQSDDSFAETGVRHLKVEVQKKRPSRAS
jgi:hypothetical protein